MLNHPAAARLSEKPGKSCRWGEAGWLACSGIGARTLLRLRLGLLTPKIEKAGKRRLLLLDDLWPWPWFGFLSYGACQY